MWRSLNLCNDAGVNIDVYDAPWLAYSRSPLADEGMTLSIYSQKPDADWKPLARQLLSEIGTTWPETITFRGRSGHPLSFEDAMNGRS
ncbi:MULTISPECIES: hypothetical protein [Bradyrhizobium]|uniref:hypothetical protein n=1 Tax=Bradyrhizobium TaxID=374 RepID=UPI001EDA2430|nr:hypothetical protein [Bradyrhizobium zhengyangense]MCG2637827.1 hypothetical protein [Bradyrhizobium zhengyangense]